MGNDPPSISSARVAPPYAPPLNPPLNDSQLAVFDSTTGTNNRRGSGTSQLSSSSHMANAPRDNFTSQAPGPSYNSWQNQQATPSQPSWQQNQPPPQQSSYQPNNVANQQSWQQNQSNNDALTISSKQPSNQWASSMT